jgi:mannosyltransferase OCH1-like enzyme
MPTAIPKLFHRIWIGGVEPTHHWRWQQSWRRHHPDWEIVTWTEHSLPPLRNQRWFDAATSPAQRSDIARYELLARYGGVYLDVDMEALRPIDPLLEDVSFFCASEDEVWLSIGIIGCQPGDPVAEAVVEQLPASMSRRPGQAINVQSGPQFFTRVVNRLRSGPDPAPVTVFPSSMFYPYHFSEPERAGGPFPGAYAVHHWNHSWSAA